MNTNTSKIRVLHAVGHLNRGGIETWLMHLMRHIDRDRFSMDFLVQTDQPNEYDQDVLALGGKVIPCLNPARVWRYTSELQRILCEYGPYDVVHSHISFSGVIVREAWKAGVPIRIVHSHNDSGGLISEGGLRRRLFLAATNRWINRYATIGFGCSDKAAAARFGKNWRSDPRWRIVYCSIDLKPFQQVADSASMRRELGIPVDALLIGHVGRFDYQKNHEFLVDIAEEVVKIEPRAHFLLIGIGPLRQKIERAVQEKGLSGHVTFTGARSDVAALMAHVMDVFLLPSHFEGLPLVLLEAQAAGLPCVCSDVVTTEVDIVSSLIHRSALSRSASQWATTVVAAYSSTSQLDREQAVKTMGKSPFNIEHGVTELESYYSGEEPS